MDKFSRPELDRGHLYELCRQPLEPFTRLCIDCFTRLWRAGGYEPVPVPLDEVYRVPPTNERSMNHE
jgi:hypothetical protein